MHLLCNSEIVTSCFSFLISFFLFLFAQCFIPIFILFTYYLTEFQSFKLYSFLRAPQQIPHP
jgi:hypothetical protein